MNSYLVSGRVNFLHLAHSCYLKTFKTAKMFEFKFILQNDYLAAFFSYLTILHHKTILLKTSHNLNAQIHDRIHFTIRNCILFVRKYFESVKTFRNLPINIVFYNSLLSLRMKQTAEFIFKQGLQKITIWIKFRYRNIQ